MAGLRAEPGTGEARRDARAPQRCPELVAEIEGRRENADERIARAGGVHRLYRQSSDAQSHIRAYGNRPFSAQRCAATTIAAATAIATECATI